MEPQPPAVLLSEQLVDGRYRVGELIGRGAMSEVYRATDERLDRVVALKALRPDSTDPARFDEETSLLCALDHPHLVRLHDAGTHDGTPYLVLNLLAGTLADRLDRGPLTPEEVARTGAEVASALAYLHANGIVHRDVKPSNVLLREDGTACLADLGAALSADGPRVTATGLTIGTPRYLAPEQAGGDPVTAATDVYSLGLVLLEAATGEPPFGGTHQESLAARLTRSPAVPPSLPAALRAQLEPMVALDPAARPAAASVSAALGRLRHDDRLVGDGAGAAGRTTAVMAVPTAVGPVVGAGGDTEVFEPLSTGAAAGAGRATMVDRLAAWTSAHRDRAVWWAVGAALLLALAVGLASAGGDDPVTEVEPSATTVAPTTTLPPTTTTTTLAPAPPPQPQDTCEEGCGGARGRERKPGKKDDDD